MYVPPRLIPCLANELSAFNLQYVVFEDSSTTTPFDVLTIPGYVRKHVHTPHPTQDVHGVK